MRDLVGTLLSHFRIVEKIGEGGMGVVYKATDEKLRRTIALKVLPEAMAKDEPRRRRLLREARAAAAVTHPNIATVHEVGESDGSVFIAMEYVEGETLRDRLGGGALAVPTALAIALQIARGLAKAHQANVVHRDLKPENVVVGENEHVKLLDFGLAKLREEPAATPSVLEAQETASVLTEEGKLLGTPGYMSPEQARGLDVDVRTDVFAFGVVLYEMVAGERPFVGQTTQDVLTSVIRDTPRRASERCPEVPAQIDRVIERCLEKVRDGRYANGQEVVDALCDLLPEARVSDGSRQRAPSAPTVSLLTPAASTVAPRGTARWRWRLAALAGIAATLLVGVRWWGTGRGTNAPALATSARDGASGPDGAPEAMSRSSNPEAQRDFEEALTSFHDGTGQAETLLERAVKADPSFGGAYLRLNLVIETGTPEATKRAQDYYRRVVVLAPTLSPRDRAFFELVDADEGVTSDASNIPARLDAYLDRYPDDGVAWMYRVASTEMTGQLEVLDRALAADGTFVPALAAKAKIFAGAERYDEADRVIAHCLEVSPRATNCLAERARRLSSTGKCAQAEADVRRWLDLEPDSRSARELLAALLAAQHSPIEAVRQALAETDSASGGTFRDMQGMLREGAVPMLAGDFTEVIRVAEERALRARTSVQERDHYLPAATQVLAYTEAGDLASAGRVAADYLARRTAWSNPPPSHEAYMLAAAARGGYLDTKAADSRRAAAFQAMVGYQVPPPQAWLAVYTWGVETRREAMVAVAVLDQLHAPLPDDSRSASSRTLFLAGRWDQARPILESLVQMCELVLSNTQNWLRAHLYLGEMDEKRGETASACSHYGQVLAVWGHAKPRSVTLEQAKQRMNALACPR